MTDEFRVATPRVAAGVLIRDDRGAVLLVKPTYKKGWDIPGGYVEPAESPRDAAAREVREELGLDCAIGRLIAIDWAPHPDEGDKLLFVFAASAPDVADRAELERDELAAITFVTADRLGEYLPPRLLSRIQSALADDADPYLEHGTRRRESTQL